MRRPRIILALGYLLGVALIFWPARPLRSDNFVFYFPNAHHVLLYEDIEHTKYLPLIQLLNLVAKVDGLQEKRAALKIWMGATQLQLHSDDKRVQLDKQQLTLSDPARISNGQWMVPVDFLTVILPRIVHDTVRYQLGTNRVFIGNVKSSSFTVRLDPVSNGARLTMQFTDPVTVRTASKDGKWVMYLGDHPMEPLEPTFPFQSPYLRELHFDDQDGTPKLVLTPSESGLNFYPVLAEGGKVLLADVLKPPPAVVEQPHPAATTSTSVTPPATPGIEEIPATPPGPALPLVVLDAGHGGEDNGARSQDGLLEKDLSAQLVARVRLALLATKKFRILLTRLGDTSLSFEQRETATNTARAAVFLTFHAGDLGSGSPRVEVYTYKTPSRIAETHPPDPPGPFIPWAKVQQAQLARSRGLAQALQQRLAQVPGALADPPAEAPVRMLRSVDAPAVAIELGSLSPETNAGALARPEFQQDLAAAIAQALQDFQGGAT